MALLLSQPVTVVVAAQYEKSTSSSNATGHRSFFDEAVRERSHSGQRYVHTYARREINDDE